MTEDKKVSGFDFAQGVALPEFSKSGILQGHAKGEPVMVVRRADTYFAIGASCTHYGAPLTEGLVVDDTVRCPWHHACFSLRTGEALRAPALDAVSSWRLKSAAASSSCARSIPKI
jgi:nitrite reductase/ring-hydroxylating ferredoxin subunit